MNLYFNAKFTGLHLDTTLISIAVVSEDNRHFYAVLNDFDKDQLSEWEIDNVLPNLVLPIENNTNEDDYYVASRAKKNKIPNDLYNAYSLDVVGNISKISNYFREWIKQFDNEKIVFVSDCAHYSFPLLIDLLSENALELPTNICPAYHDINTDISKYHNIDEFDAFDVDRENILKANYIVIPSKKYNALHDATVIMEIYKLINNKI